MDDMQIDSRFGVCPECGSDDGYINAGRDHYFICKEDRLYWHIGSNLFESWRRQTEEEQRAEWDRIGMDDFRKVEPARSIAEVRRSKLKSI